MNDTQSHQHDHHQPHGAAAGTNPGGGDVRQVVDPVCGMKVDPATSPHHLEHEGQEVFFCSTGCKAKFEADPTRYLAAEDRPPAPPAPEGAIYTCPMHPQIRQVGPGFCPICGMALEPASVTADQGPSPELKDRPAGSGWASCSRRRCSSWRWAAI